MGEWPNPNGGLSVEKNDGTPGRGSPGCPAAPPAGLGGTAGGEWTVLELRFPHCHHLAREGEAGGGVCAASRKDMAFGRAEDGKFVFHMAMEFLLDVMARCSLAGVARFSVENSSRCAREQIRRQGVVSSA